MLPRIYEKTIKTAKGGNEQGGWNEFWPKFWPGRYGRDEDCSSEDEPDNQLLRDTCGFVDGMNYDEVSHKQTAQKQIKMDGLSRYA